MMRERVCAFARRICAERLSAGTSGNLSAADRDAGVMVITPSSVPYEELGPGDMVVMRPDGTVLEGRLRPSSEWRMHAAVYRAYPDVGALVHTHSPYATAFAVNHRPIPPVLIEMAVFLGGDVPLAGFAVPGTEAVGLEAVRALRHRGACLLANHGVLAAGKDLAEAHLRAVYVEDAAKICSLALGNGPVFPIDGRDLREMGCAPDRREDNR